MPLGDGGFALAPSLLGLIGGKDMKKAPNVANMNKAQLIEVVNTQFQKECELWEDITSRDATIKELRETKTRLELEIKWLTTESEEATLHVERLQAERKKYADTAADLHDYIETIRAEQRRDKVASEKMHTKLMQEIKKWKVLLANEIMEGEND